MTNLWARANLLFAGLIVSGSPVAVAGNVYPNLAAFASDIPETAEWYQQCLRVRSEKTPGTDLASPRESSALKRCNANDLYYDTLNKPAPTNADWQKVRECAFAIQDTGVLTMLYANGKGVAKNLRLATKYACGTSSAIAEMAGRVDNLTGRMKGGQAEDFDNCEDVTSGYMQGICALIDERQQEKRRNARLAAITRQWPAKDQAVFQKLKDALRNFAQYRSDDETDLSGTARSALAAYAMSAELDQFINDIENFETGKLPRFTSSEFNDVDKRLNDSYQSFMRVPHLNTSSVGTVEKRGVKKTQRAWLVYRGAMVVFGAARYPGVPVNAWKALLTERRSKQLLELSEAARGEIH
jgi:uncharacterized protein YecT (DUF1311 family)